MELQIAARRIAPGCAAQCWRGVRLARCPSMRSSRMPVLARGVSAGNSRWSIKEASGLTISRRGFFFGGSTEASSSEQPEAEAEEEEKENKSVVLSKRASKDYIENTLRPHLESQLLDGIQAYTPAELVQIARAYSKHEPRQYNLCVKLADTVIFRIKGFEAVDIVDILQAMYIMTPGVEYLWEELEKRSLAVLDQFTALNLMGVVRIFNKLPSTHPEFMAVVMPRLKELLKDYEAVELHDMLVSMGQAIDAQQDMDILGLVVPEIERRFSELSLLHSINVVWALTQLKVIHPPLLTRVAHDISNEKKIKDVTPNFIARIVWIYRRCDHWSLVSETMLPLVKAAASEYKPGDFARLAQALPDERASLERIANALLPGLEDMGRKEFSLFLLGCVHGMLLEIDPKAPEEEGTLVNKCLEYMRQEQDNFQREEVERVATLLAYSSAYKHVLDHLPPSWKPIKVEVLDYIAARG
mmetsp:Transcript_47267/g.86797  ORF Transcript_47267/g.86797 Transcript_47267/m.86797 type:complete len:471 (+) Transcript_47267:54-1466(+)